MTSKPELTGVQLFQELGTIAGRLLFAFLVVRIATQKYLLHVFLVPGSEVSGFVSRSVLNCLIRFLRRPGVAPARTSGLFWADQGQPGD